jgi:hypothetical protein
MEPELPKAYNGRATLADLLDRVLDKGLFLRADLVISVAGIPLIGVTLSAAVASIETLFEYGIMSDWDQAIRALPPGQRQTRPSVRQPPEPRPAQRVASAVPG